MGAAPMTDTWFNFLPRLYSKKYAIVFVRTDALLRKCADDWASPVSLVITEKQPRLSIPWQSA